ncbi:MAG: MFS transporter, partial [Gammaproteobacteria bacterium]
MSTPETSLRVGPIWLAPGVTRVNVWTKWWAAFVTIALLSGSSLLQGYLLTEHLGIPRGQQGTVSGEISFWVEIVAILLFNPFGILADRIGRRPVYLIGMFFIGLGFGLAPFARTYEELLAFRLIFAVGMAASAGTMATLTSDYPREDSRGLMVGITAVFNTLGTIFIANAVARIPSLLMDRGQDAIAGGTAMYLFAAGMAFVTIVIAQLGLAPGTPVAKHERPPVARLYKAGFLAARNPRIALAYAGSFAARADLVIKGLFFSLWAIQDGRGMGLNPGDSMARFGIMFAIMSGVSMVSAP